MYKKLLRFFAGVIGGYILTTHFFSIPIAYKLGLLVPDLIWRNNIITSIELHLMAIFFGVLLQFVFNRVRIGDVDLLVGGGVVVGIILRTTPLGMFFIASTLFPFTSFAAVYLGGVLYRREIYLVTALMLISIILVIPGAWWALAVRGIQTGFWY